MWNYTNYDTMHDLGSSDFPDLLVCPARNKELVKSCRHTVRNKLAGTRARTVFQGHTHMGGGSAMWRDSFRRQTAPSNEHKKASRDKIRKYKEN